jgi:hypothetical protein
MQYRVEKSSGEAAVAVCFFGKCLMATAFEVHQQTHADYRY